jgi:TonB-dependent receptor
MKKKLSDAQYDIIEQRSSIMKTFLTMLVVLLIFPTLVLAQGTIRGLVSDATSGDALVGANILVKGTALGAATDLYGKYRITNVTPGEHTLRVTYVGYKTKEVKIDVKAAGETVVDVKLVADVIEGQEVLVTAQMRGQVAAINQQLTSNTIVNVVSEEKIKELPDANAAEAIGRLPGVSIIRSGGEANKVILRGMSDKFTSFTIDGVRIPPTDADTRGVDLSTFSQGTLSGVELFKALTPDKDGDAIAGSINLVTRKAPSTRTIRLDLKGAYNKLDDDLGQYDINGRYGERFFDDILGVQVTGNIERRNRSNEQFSLDIENQASFNSTGFKYNDLTVQYTHEIRERYGVGLLLDINTPDSGSIRINNLFNQTNRNYTNYNRNYPVGGNDAVNYVGWDREQDVNSFNSSIRGDNYLYDFNLTWGLSFAESNTKYPYDYRLVFTEPSITDSAGMRAAPEWVRTSSPENFIQYAYNNFGKAKLDSAFYRREKNSDRERTAFLDIARKYALGDLFSGEFKFGGKYRYKNRFKETYEDLAPYWLGYYQDYTRDASGNIVGKNFQGTRFQNLQLVGRLVLLTNFLASSPAQRDLYGKYSLYPLIERDALRDWYELNKNGISQNGRQLEYYNDPEQMADYYDIIERVSSGYVMNTLNIGTFATLIAGVRVERETNDYLAKYVTSPLSGFPTIGSLKDTTSHYSETLWLPNFHLTVRPLDYLTVRLAAYRAIARPDYNTRFEKMIARVTSPRSILVVGNPDLKNAKAWNFEINASLFGNEIGLFTVSAFYREIDDMFHTVSGIIGDYKPADSSSLLNVLDIGWHPDLASGSPITLTYSVNSTKPTKVWGFEIEHQANLGFLPGYLSNIVLSYNLSIVRSETWVLGYKVDTTYAIIPPIPFPLPQYSTHLVESKNKLEGQPELFGNVAIGYDIGGFSGRLSVFFQTEYTRSYSASRMSDPVVQDFTRWDLTLRQRVTPNISVFFNLNNFTSVEEEVYTTDHLHNWDALRSSQKYGLTGDLGVRLEL